MIYLFAVHVLLLILAATDFTVLGVIFGDGSFGCDFFKISYSYGFGRPTASDFSIWQALAYAISYGLGIPVFTHAWRLGWHWPGALGVGLSCLGFLSFVIEAVRIAVSGHLSLIASFPVVMVVLWVCWAVMFLHNRENMKTARE